jgi:hypothetical protein
MLDEFERMGSIVKVKCYFFAKISFFNKEYSY